MTDDPRNSGAPGADDSERVSLSKGAAKSGSAVSPRPPAYGTPPTGDSGRSAGDWGGGQTGDGTPPPAYGQQGYRQQGYSQPGYGQPPAYGGQPQPYGGQPGY